MAARLMFTHSSACFFYVKGTKNKPAIKMDIFFVFLCLHLMFSIEKIKWRDSGVRRVTVPPALWHTISDVLEVEEMTEN